jgi:hypothetical protein
MDETNNSLSDIDLYFNNSNLGIGKSPTSKLDVDGDISGQELNLKNTSFSYIGNRFKISHNDSSSIILSKDKSVIFTNNLGVNNLEPRHTLDVEGEIKFKGNILGNNGPILSENSDISFNKNSAYENINFFGNVNLVNDSNLSLSNKLNDNKNNELLNFSNDKSFIFNQKYTNDSKDITFYGPVNFNDLNKGVKIGGDENIDVGGGSLYVEDSIKTKKIEFHDDSDRKINFVGDNASNIKLGKYSYLSNLSTNDISNQTALFGHNLYADNNNFKIAETTEDYGYRGIIMNNINGIQFYTSDKITKADDLPELPQVTISNSGQLIYTIPVLPFDFELDNLDNEVYKYIRKEIKNKKVGSTMTFTTQKHLTDDKIFNVIKNSETTSKCYIIDKKTNNVSEYFDVSF